MTSLFTNFTFRVSDTKRVLRLSIFSMLASSIFLTSCKDNSANTTPTPVVVDVSKAANTYSADVATKWTDLQLLLIKSTTGYTPPIAARALGYSGLALYESVVPGISGYQSLAGQLKDITTLPKTDATKEYNWVLAANSAEYTLLKSLYATTSDANKTLMDSLSRNIETSIKRDLTQDVTDRSIKFGTDIANAIFEYSKTDGGHEAYKNVYPADYILPTGAGAWEPTSTQKIPMLPYWGKVRQFVAANANANPPAPLVFSYKTTSDFYKDALEVYNTNKNLTADQKNIGLYWADGGGTITPPGHHANIASIVLKKENAKLDKAAEVYAKLGMGVSDAFVSCWKCKYAYSLLRPVTYIKNVIDPAFAPLIATPPFPEYTSGHSSGSGAASQILTDIFGENYAFTDNTWESKFTNRTFKSFFEYADEATISRLYGGIHYRNGNEKGQANGKLIGKNITALKFKKPTA